MEKNKHHNHFESLVLNSLKATNSKDGNLQIVGGNNSIALANFISNLHDYDLGQKSHLIIVPNNEYLDQLLTDLSFFKSSKKIVIYKSNNLNPYNTVIPSYVSLTQKISFLSHLVLNKEAQIFILSAENLLEKCIPLKTLESFLFNFKIGSELPTDFYELLNNLGYRSVTTVEENLSYSHRGDILDLYSPYYEHPLRIELFGDNIESIRLFDLETQRSIENLSSFIVCPARECLTHYSEMDKVIKSWKQSFEQNQYEIENVDQFIRKLAQGQYFHGIDNLLPYFYNNAVSIQDYISNSKVYQWIFDHNQVEKVIDLKWQSLKSAYSYRDTSDPVPYVEDLYIHPDRIKIENSILLNSISIIDDLNTELKSVHYSSSNIHSTSPNSQELTLSTLNKIKSWIQQEFKVVIGTATNTQLARIKILLEDHNINFKILSHEKLEMEDIYNSDFNEVLLTNFNTSSSTKLTEENLIFINDFDFFGKKRSSRATKSSGSIEDRAGLLKFGDLQQNDKVVHIQHGVGVYEGLKIMTLNGAKTEFIQLSYKDGDKLYLPVYRIGQLQKYNGGNTIDKLGGKSWEKAKVKVKNALKDIANELLTLYAKRESIFRKPYSAVDKDYQEFEDKFPYTETEDQEKAINDILSDFTKTKPSDRLICGDVGFGKTEIAMRAAFKVIQEGKQVALLVPTTVLAFQHFENFLKRFKNWPIEIRSLSRFTSAKDAKDTLLDLKQSKVDLVIGTHRLLSKDVSIPNLGLLIIDEEQRFGVTHKEKLKQLKANVDTIAMSATPIPRTLNMSLVGMRDLSIINTPPQDRLPTRTHICKFNKNSIRQAILTEVQRGGQVYFLHNRVQSIYSRADEIRQLVPEAKIKVAHGQMKEGELEQVILSFFKHEFDVLICTAIIESGVDNPKANTMLIDNAHQLGLSQLYQLRGRVGRSNERAYCYLVIPQNVKLDQQAQDRLKVIQENSALGSGFKIAHHDLELRGAGNILGDSQSGHVNTVGYDLYLELLEEAIKKAKGEEIIEKEVEPEINLRIPALIPDQYIPDIRSRLAYYKKMSEINEIEDLEKIEEDLQDQFGKLPDEVINLMGIMLIRKHCKTLGIKDISSGPKNLSISFSETTKVSPVKMVQLTISNGDKYKLTPDSRLIVKLTEITWPRVLDEVKSYENLID